MTRIRPSRLSLTAGLVALVAGCTSPGPAAGPSTPVVTTVPVAAEVPPTSSAPAPAAAALGLIVEPDDGIAPIDALLSSPTTSIDLEIYELVDTRAEALLVADAARGVRVRVVLDRNREEAANTPAYSYLRARGVGVVWAPASYEATHEKAMVIDAGHADQRAVVMTLNLVSEDYAGTRDVAVVDPQAADVAAIESVFDADYAGDPSAPTPPGADLVWSPGSTQALVGFLGSGRRALDVENEEMDDPDIERSLAAAAQTGVTTQVTMTESSDDRSALSKLVAEGVDVRTLADEPEVLYIHAKVVVTDPGTARGRAFVGSQNFSEASLERNRELGVLITDPAIVERLAGVLAADHAAASAG